jgi:hypothetical protein
MMARMQYSQGAEVGVVWVAVGSHEEKRHKRAEIRVRYRGREIGYAESSLVDRDASAQECVRVAAVAALEAISNAVEFLDDIQGNLPAIIGEVTYLRRSFGDVAVQ